MATGTKDLPVHFRTGLRAVGIVNGRPVWPILGGEESDEAAAQAAAKVATDAKAAADAAKGAENDKGYPDGTPVAEMTDRQQAAYYKAQARKHEDRNKAIGLTAEQVQELRAKADKHDALEAELASDADKKAAEARKTAISEADAKYLPRLVNAEFKAAAAGRIEAERLATILEPLDMSKFLTASGDVDTDKVAAFVDGIAPATGNQQNQGQRRGPGSHGQGNRGGSGTGPSVQAGRDRYLEKHPVKQ